MALAPEVEVVKDMARYASLGLIANPFAVAGRSEDPGIQCEIASEGNRLVRAILELSRQDSPKPLWVRKADLPAYYANAAMAHAESSLAIDDSLNVLYAYVQLYTMRIGVTRSALNLVAERLSFRSFDRTLAAYLEGVLAAPDPALTSYQVMAPERLDAFAAQFREDPLAATRACFGMPEYERQPELKDAIDFRQGQMDGEVVDENDETAEVDESLGEAPGTAQTILAERERDAEDTEDLGPVRDYLIEYTRAHLSSVIARALRVYHDRGLVAMAAEFKVTKAPRKTLGAVVKLARSRFANVAILFDEFRQWRDIDADLRSKMIAAFSELRWKLDRDAFPVFLVEDGVAPELEETFSTGTTLDWTFAGLDELQQQPDAIDSEVVRRWIAAASDPFAARGLDIDDPVLSRLVEAAEGSLSAFLAMAFVAVEDAAQRGSTSLDEASYETGAAAKP